LRHSTGPKSVDGSWTDGRIQADLRSEGQLIGLLQRRRKLLIATFIPTKSISVPDAVYERVQQIAVRCPSLARSVVSTHGADDATPLVGRGTRECYRVDDCTCALSVRRLGRLKPEPSRSSAAS
jgi:hypothetical protein